MTSWIVVDSGVFLATILDEPLSDKAGSLIRFLEEEKVLFAAPHLLQYEVASVIRKHTHKGNLTPDDAESALDLLLSRDIEFIFDNALVKRAYELAAQFQQSAVYDSQYLAVAERLACDFWTKDKRLFNAVSSQLAWVKWIGDFETTS